MTASVKKQKLRLTNPIITTDDGYFILTGKKRKMTSFLIRPQISTPFLSSGRHPMLSLILVRNANLSRYKKSVY